MPPPAPEPETAAGRRLHWGRSAALLDDDEARRQLLGATARCIVRRGNARISISEVAGEAQVARSTVYRYFANREELITALMTGQAERALRLVVSRLDDPADPARSLVEMLLGSVSFVDASPLMDALFSAESQGLVTVLEMGSEAVLDATVAVYGPLLEGWRGSGLVHADLDVRETIRWLNATALMLLTPPWRTWDARRRTELLERTVVRALVLDRHLPPHLQTR